MIDHTFVTAIRSLAAEAEAPWLGEVGGVKLTDKTLKVAEPERGCDAVRIHTLQGAADYIAASPPPDGSVLHVESETSVRLLGPVEGFHRKRPVLAVAVCPTSDPFPFGRYIGQEEFIVKLLSNFVDTLDREKVVALAGNIQDDESVQLTDDGTSQKAVAKRGVATVAQIKLPNPVTLAPLRTFPELEQPAGKFIFRLQKGLQMTLFDADCGKWRVEAIGSVAAFLKGKIPKTLPIIA